MADVTCEITLDETTEALLQRHADWWQRKATLVTRIQGTSLGDLWLPLADGTTADHDIDLTPDMLDIERLVGKSFKPGPLETSGDLIATAAPYMRVPWLEAILGAPIRATIQGGSMRAHAFVRKWTDWEVRPHCIVKAWRDLLLNMTELHVTRSGGRHAVAQTLMRGPSDLAEAVLGPEMMSFATFDHPQALRHFLDEVTDVFIEVLHAQLGRIPPIKGGYVNPFGIWSPGTVVRTQCDASAFLSPKHYAQWYLPYDVRICETVDYSVIHLHSVSLHTVDALLAVERPHVIQVIVETSANAPTLDAMLPIFRKILATKPLIIEGPLSEDEVKRLLDALPSGGLCIIAREAAW
ncbi:MAG: hypothetical protein JXR84_08995 [Anaerolineae bacterium]|nr:hypothetical protein [Anaerolineae bacterium]